MQRCGTILLHVLFILTCLAAPVAARTWHVDGAHAEASDENDGTAAAPLRTIGRAATEARAGDTVQVAAGVYREHVAPIIGGAGPDRMITYEARPGNEVVVKGSDLWTPRWTRAAIEGVGAVVWRAELDPSLFTYDFPIENFNPFVQSPLKIYSSTVEQYYEPVRPVDAGEPLPVTRGAIFLDGKPLAQITDPAGFDYASGVFLVSADGGTVLARLPHDREPYGLTFEIVTREQVFAPRETSISFIRLRGLTFEHGANGNGVPQFGMVSASKGRNWIIEDCTIRWAGTFGIDVGDQAWYQPPGRIEWWNVPGRREMSTPAEGELDFHMIVRRCTISDNGTSGLMCYGSNRSILVEDCLFERNNRLGRLTWEEAGLKCHGVTRCVFRNNFFRDNDSYGLWLDVGGSNNRITQNLFIGNRNAGVFIEAVAGTTLIDNNISACTKPLTFYQMTQADGFYNHQASNVIFAHNLAFANTGFGFRCVLHSASGANSFPGGKVKVSHNRVFNNIAYANARGAVGLPVDQRLCWGNQSDHNFFWGPTDAPLFELTRGIVDPHDLAASVEKALAAHSLSPHAAPLLHRWLAGTLGPQVGDMRHNGPLVTLPLWRAVTGRDTHSVAGPVPKFHVYSNGRLFLDLKRPDKARGGVGIDGQTRVVGAEPDSYAAPGDVVCRRLSYVTHDYFGRPRPEDAPPTVGPFQDLSAFSGARAKLEGAAQGMAMETIDLWPNAAPQRPPATEMRIDIEMRPVIREEEP